MKILSRPVRTFAALFQARYVARFLAGLCLLGATAASAAPRIDSVSRSAGCDGQGTDFSPFAEDDVANNAASSVAGGFTGNAAVPIALNDNVALFESAQTSTVNPADLTFSGNGSAHIDQEGRFDAADIAGGAFFQGSSHSSLTLFFTLTGSGKVTLATTLTAARTFSGGVSPGGVGVSTQIEIKRGTTVVWSRFISSGTLSFSGDVALAAGQYQLTVTTGSNVSLAAAGTQFAETTGSFTINGKISETAGSGGGKKGGK